MSELYVVGKLELFKDVFPIDDYMKHLAQRLAFVIATAKRGHAFEKDILEKFHANKVKIPMLSYILAPAYMVGEFAREKLRTVKWVRNIYRKFGLDKILYGRKTDDSTWVDKK